MADENRVQAFSASGRPQQDNPCAEHNAPLLKAIYSAGICVLYQTPDLIYTRAENLPAPLQAKWRESCREADLFPPAAAAQMEALKKQVLAGGPAARLEVRLPQKQIAAFAAAKSGEAAEAALKAEARAAALALEQESLQPELAGQFSQTSQTYGIYDHTGQTLWFKFSIEAHRNAQGEILGIITTGVNISELRAREEVLKVLLREVSHRSKNLLAIIQSIAAQTARFCHNISGFLKKFQGRLQSLSSSQDLVTDSDWRGALLQDLIFAQTRFYTDSVAAREKCSIAVKGENPYLFPSAALHVGLALHELIINSASYGALAKGEGGIEICCRALPAETAERAENEEESGALMLSWREEFPPEAAQAASLAEQAEAGTGAAAPGAGDFAAGARFGSIVLERIVPVSVDGEAQYSIKNGIIEYSLKIPVSQFAYDKA